MIPSCILQSDISSELIGTFTEVRNENDMNHGIIRTIGIVTRERLKTICKVTDTEYIKKQLIPIEQIAREKEKNIISYFAKQIEPHQSVGFFRFWVKQWQLVQSTIFEELYRLYALRHWTDEADYMEEKMTNLENEWKSYIIVEYGRNMKNKELFIQRIFLKETK